MREYKLKYTDKVEAEADLKLKGILDEEGMVTEGHSVVQGIKIVSQEATYDENGEVLTEAVFEEGYHVDVFSSDENLDFGEKLVNPEPSTPAHKFWT